MALVAVVAVATHGVIGLNNAMPWHLPEDLRRFKALTQGHPVLMGRKTYESILAQLGKPLPGRPHWVITRQPDWAAAAEHAAQVRPAASLEAAMAEAEQSHPGRDLMLVGGAEIYGRALASDLVDRVELTLVHAEPPGDAFFPLDSLRDAQRWQWEAETPGEGCTFWTVRRRR